jgi:glycosyltransferase involved in cell wall biosynthesis
MAAYNGERFLREQLQSILAQLGLADEVVVCDDGSTDGTVSLLESVRDPRLKIERHERNLGLFPAISRALTRASGDILFLSDQDDVWMPHKTLTVLGVFRDEPAVTLVLSDATVIDAGGREVASSYVGLPPGTGSGTWRAVRSIAKNRYLGGAIAFRRSMLRVCLPIPAAVPMHDMWIGILNDLYGKTYYVPEPLIAYRRHDRNVTRSSRAGIGQIAVWRWRLVRELIRRARTLRRQ